MTMKMIVSTCSLAFALSVAAPHVSSAQTGQPATSAGQTTGTSAGQTTGTATTGSGTSGQSTGTTPATGTAGSTAGSDPASGTQGSSSTGRRRHLPRTASPLPLIALFAAAAFTAAGALRLTRHEG
jgi:hypothetical protein